MIEVDCRSTEEIPLDSQSECLYRQNIRSQGDVDIADCQLLGQILGVSDGPHVVVRQDACAACTSQSPPSVTRLNPATASLLHKTCENIVAQKGVPGCDVTKANRLKKWAYDNIPFVPTKSNPLGSWQGFHHVQCADHIDDESHSQAPCIHLTRSISHLIGQGFHRSGWPFAVRNLSPLFCKQGILFDDFIEQRFCYGTERTVYTTPWVGVFHHTAQVPKFVEPQYALEQILEGAAWKESEKQLRGAIALSEHVASYLRTRLKVPVAVVKHPSEIPERTWSEDAYLQNENKCLLQLGWFLRNTRAIFQLPSLAEHGKLRCLPGTPWVAEYDNRVSEYWKSETTRDEYGGVTELGYIPNDQYDSLLTSNVILTELFEASANNVVIECIARSTPLVVNRLPATMEYLTPDYPLFFDDLDEVPELLTRDNVLAAHRHLRAMNKDWLNEEHFCNSIRSALLTMDLSRPTRASQSNVDGWYDAQFNKVLQQIDRQQQAGHIGEIGVHHGKSFVHISRLCRRTELALAVDCFHLQQHNRSQSGHGSKDILLRNLRDSIQVRILEGDSLEFTASDYMAAVGGRFRIFHIDGGHDFATTLHDLTQAAQTLTDDGVLVVNDVFNEEWPEVSQAFYQFVASSHLKPFAIAHNKVCLSCQYYQLQSRRFVKEWLGQPVQIL